MGKGMNRGFRGGKWHRSFSTPPSKLFCWNFPTFLNFIRVCVRVRPRLQRKMAQVPKNPSVFFFFLVSICVLQTWKPFDCSFLKLTTEFLKNKTNLKLFDHDSLLGVSAKRRFRLFITLPDFLATAENPFGVTWRDSRYREEEMIATLETSNCARDWSELIVFSFSPVFCSGFMWRNPFELHPFA